MLCRNYFSHLRHNEAMANLGKRILKLIVISLVTSGYIVTSERATCNLSNY